MIEYTVKVHADGSRFWYLNGKEMTEQEHKKATAKNTCEGKEVVVDGKFVEMTDE
jgi:hypothetical protein